MKSNATETLLGGFVLVIAGFFLFYAYQTAGLRGVGNGYEVSADFTHVAGVSIGTDVRLSGIKIGAVTDMALDYETYIARVSMTINDEVRLPEDTSAKITSDGLLGRSYIALQPGGAEEFIEAGGEISHTAGSIDLMSLIGQAIFSFGDK